MVEPSPVPSPPPTEAPAAKVSATEAPPTGFVARARGWWQRQSQKLKDHFAEYGSIAIVTYFVIFFATWAGFAIAIARGFSSDASASDASTIGAAWVATKTTQPLRILATLAVTPFVAAAWHRIRGRKPAPPSTTKESE